MSFFTIRLFQGLNITDLYFSLHFHFSTTTWFFRHKKRLKRMEHLLRRGSFSCELYYSMYIVHTLYNVILHISRNFLETRENFKISIHPFYHTNLVRFSWEWSKKKNEEKNLGWEIFQNRRLSKSPILEIFLRKFHRLVLGLVRLIDVKGINVTQLIWLSGSPT